MVRMINFNYQFRQIQAINLGDNSNDTIDVKTFDWKQKSSKTSFHLMHFKAIFIIENSLQTYFA